MNEGASGGHDGMEKHGANDLQVCGNCYMGDVSRMSLLHHGVELPGIICTADRFGLS